MSENVIDCVCIAGNRFADQAMRSFGVFETFKALATPERMQLTLNPDCSVSRAIQDIKMAVEKSGWRVVAVFSPGNPEGAWRDDSVTLVSNGTQFCRLDDMLKRYGFVGSEVTHDS